MKSSQGEHKSFAWDCQSNFRHFSNFVFWPPIVRSLPILNPGIHTVKFDMSQCENYQVNLRSTLGIVTENSN